MKNNGFLLYSSSALSTRHSGLIAAIAFSAGISLAQDALALPYGATVVSGQASISHPSSTQEVITQTTDKTVINWQNFDTLNGQSTQFVQPSSSSIALNRVTSGSPTQILGSLSANGQLWLVNPDGVFFGASSKVSVGGLLVSTADIQNNNFNKGNYKFNKAGKPSASIINQGSITAADGGLVALVAPGVRNDGVIKAKYGTVALGAGQTATVDLYGDNLYSFSIDKPIAQAALDQNGKPMTAALVNTGTISAPGGTIYMTARAAKNVVDQAINTTGIVEATAVRNVGGTIILDGGDGAVNVAGALNASGKQAGQTGGTIAVEGGNVTLASGAVLDASGANGGGQVNVGGGLHGQGSLAHAQTVTAESGSVINASATENGNGGTVVLWSDNDTAFDGTIVARGGANGGNGGMVETSGATLSATGTVDASAAHGQAGTWLLDPNNIIIEASGSDTNVSGNPNFTTTGDSAVVTTSSIDNALNGGTNVSITTGSAGANTQSGTIEVASSIAKTAGGNASLSLNAASDITVDPNVSISSTAGMLNVTLASDQAGNGGHIAMESGSSILSNGGSITLGGGANPSVTPAVGDAAYQIGVNLDNVKLTAAGGDISIRGVGYGDAGINSRGILALNGTQITTTGNGSITLSGTGNGNTGSSTDHGVNLVDPGTLVSAENGNIFITGAAGSGNGLNNAGVLISNGAVVQTTGSGNITLNGTGGAGTNKDNWGVALTGGTINAKGTGNVSITGIGGGTGSGSYNDGIYLSGNNGIAAKITTHGGSITLNGTGGTGTGGFNDGVFAQGGSPVIDAGGGNINITGIGGSGGASNNGIELYTDTLLNTTGTGSITLNGTGSTGAYLEGTISAQNGDITITGNGAGANANGLIMDGGNIATNGTGAINLTGNSTGTGVGIGSGIMTFINTVVGGPSDNGNINFTSNGLISLSDTISTQRNITFNAANTYLSSLINAGGNITINTGDMLLPGHNAITAGGTLAINNTGRFIANEAGILNGQTVTLNQNDGTPATSIQNAIDAVGTVGSGGTTLKLGKATWDETIHINRSNFNLVGSGEGNTIIQPTSVASATQVEDGPPNGSRYFAPMVLAENGDNINISNLTIDGTKIPTLPTADNPVPAGLAYNNAGGLVSNVNIIQNGAPSIVAVDSSAYGQTAYTVNVSGVTATSTDRFDMHAIGDRLTFNVTGSTLNVNDNAISGMDYAEGSSGSFTGNTVNILNGEPFAVGVGFHGANNIVVTGNTINGGGNGSYGIYSYSPDSNITITGNNITNVGYGIVAIGDSWTVLGNTITAAPNNTGNGIELHLSGINTIGNTTGGANTVSNFLNGIYVDGSEANINGNTLIGNNTGVNLTNFAYNSNVTNNTISGGLNGILADNTNDIIITGNGITGTGIGDNGTGIQLTNGNFVQITGNNTVSNFATGIGTDNSHAVLISLNTVNDNGTGIATTDNSNTFNILNNTLNGNTTGVSMDNTYFVNLNNNQLANNGTGIALSGAGTHDVNVIDNTINGAVTGITLSNAGLTNFIGYNTLTGITGDGIDVTNTSGVPIYGNSITAASGNTTGNGIFVSGGTNIQIGNSAAGNANTVSGFGTGIGADNVTHLVIDSNTVSDNGIGIDVSNSNNAVIINDIATGNGSGIELNNAQNTLIFNATLTDNGNGLFALGGSGGTLMGSTTINGGGSGTGVRLDGAGTSMQFSDHNSNFSDLASYFILQNSAMLGETLDASQQTFDGLVAHNFTFPQWVAAENITTDHLDGLAVGTVFYTSFPPAPTPILPVPTPNVVTADVTGPVNLNPLNQFLLFNDRTSFGGSLFSYAGQTIASTVREVPYNFRIAEVNLSLLAPGATAPAPTQNFADASAGQLNNLAPAAGGDVSALAALSPAAGGAPDCGNGFLGAGYALGYDSVNCRTGVSRK